ncbi:MAG: SPOR domain-containing protein [Gammaproteobacteria bacterium]
MARDYKHRRRPSKKGKGGGASFGTGLTLGLVVAVLVHLFHQGRIADGGKEVSALPTQPSAQELEPVDDTGIEFDFYTILTETEELVPDETESRAAAPAIATPTGAETFHLQAGSFQKHADADRRKATLALLGVTAAIQKVTIKENETWFRVRVGPVGDLNEANRLRSKLEAEKIQTMLVKDKD